MRRGLLMRRFAPGHFSAASRCLCHRRHIWFADRGAEKTNKAHDQQHTHAGCAHRNVSIRPGLIQIKACFSISMVWYTWTLADAKTNIYVFDPGGFVRPRPFRTRADQVTAGNSAEGRSCTRSWDSV